MILPRRDRQTTLFARETAKEQEGTGGQTMISSLHRQPKRMARRPLWFLTLAY